MRKRMVVFTGGGSAGHVTPNLALIESFGNVVNMAYIGSSSGIEKELINKTTVPFYGIATGKLRRYFSWQNFIDPFKVLYGFFQAFQLLRKLKPDVVFSKGGFVSVPVVYAAKLLKIPVVIHESDMTPGLANRLCMPLANKICVNFPQVAKLLKKSDKIIVTGTPIRSFLLMGSVEKALHLTNWNSTRPTVLVIGGSLGATRINSVVRESLNDLLKTYQVIHLCGKGNIDKLLEKKPYYYQLEYAHETLGDLFSLSQLVVSRAGANTLCELLTLAKPHLLIPLVRGSRGDQLDNAKYFQELGASRVLDEDKLTKQTFIEEINKTFLEKESLIKNMKLLDFQSATLKVKDVIEKLME